MAKTDGSAPKKVKKVKKAAASDGPKVKKAPSPYIIYCSEFRDKIKAANVSASFGEIGKLLGEGWRKLSEAQKKVYIRVDS